MITKRGTEYFNSEIENCSIFRQSPRIKHAPWSNRRVEVQNRNFGTHLRMFSLDTSEKLSIQVDFFAYGNITQPLSHLQNYSSEIVF